MFVVLAWDLSVFKCEESFAVWSAFWQSPKLDRMTCEGENAAFSLHCLLFWQSPGLGGLVGQGITASIVGQQPAFLQDFGGPLRCMVW